MDNHLVAVQAEFFLFQRGFVPITVVAAAAFAFVVAVTPTLGECCNEFCILCHDFLLALFCEFGFEKREGIEGRGYGCAGGGVQSILFPSRRERFLHLQALDVEVTREVTLGVGCDDAAADEWSRTCAALSNPLFASLSSP
jgi:hypothetical protein